MTGDEQAIIGWRGRDVIQVLLEKRDGKRAFSSMLWVHKGREPEGRRGDNAEKSAGRVRAGGNNTGSGTLDYTAIIDGELCEHDGVQTFRMMEEKRMRTIDTVYEAWQAAFWDQEDPEQIDEVYRYFRLLIRNLDQRTADKLWDAMTICQQRAAEIAFKDGYRMGYRLHNEMEV